MWEMEMSRYRSFLVSIVVGLAICSTQTGCEQKHSAPRSQSPKFHGTVIVIGVDAPVSGPLAPLGKGIVDSVRLAVGDANRERQVPGFTFRVEVRDDRASPAQGVANARAFISEPDVLGVVGPLNSGVAAAMQPVMGAEHFALISPANTDPVLTGADGSLTRPDSTYFRTVATDAVQGPVAARYALNSLKARTVFVVNDATTYGLGLSSVFRQEFQTIGGRVVGSGTATSAPESSRALALEIESSGAESVYFGGEYPAFIPLRKSLAGLGFHGRVLGGDGISTADYVRGVGQAAAGDYATGVGAPLTSLPSAKGFLKEYQAAGFHDPSGPYGGYAYDSAQVVIHAVQLDITGGSLSADPRFDVGTLSQLVDFQGVTGDIWFDGNGDINDQSVTMYEVQNKEWTPIQIISG